jgi:hypothetical protein
VMSAPINQAMLTGPDYRATGLEAVAQHGVNVFLAAYGGR